MGIENPNDSGITIPEQKNQEVKEIKLHNDHYGYTIVAKSGEKIVELKGKDVGTLKLDMQVEVVGDSMGYAGGLNPGDLVKILKFEDPDKDTAPVLVSRLDDGRQVHLKLKEIKERNDSGITIPEQKNQEVKEIKLHNDHYGYNSVVKMGEKIVAVKGKNVKTLELGMQIEVVRESQNFKVGDKVRIIKFEDPDKDTIPILVRSGDGKEEHLKFKEIK